MLRLPHRVPYHIAVGILLTGEPLPATTAHDYGLVSTLTTPGGALAAAQDLAGRIAGNAPLALAAVKEVLHVARGLNDADAVARQDQITSPLAASEDVREGALAFAQKRAPVWHGRRGEGVNTACLFTRLSG